MPKEIFGPGYEFLPRSAILSFEEIVRLATIFGRMGLRKLRLTGGEPTVRAELPTLVRMLPRPCRMSTWRSPPTAHGWSRWPPNSKPPDWIA